MNRIGAGLWALIFMAMLGVGCAKRAEESGEETTPPPPSEDMLRAQRPETTGEKPWRIAVVPKATIHDFWLTVKAGAEQAAQERKAEVIWRGPAKETDVSGQIEILEDFITKGIDAIVMAACDAEALIPTVQKAREKEIPVITIDSGIASDDALCFVATDNILGAKKAADQLAELIGGKGDVVVMPFVPGAATSQMREKGFKDQIKARYPDIKVVYTSYSQSRVDEAMRQMEDLLTRFPDLDGLFAANEPGAIGAANVLKSRNLVGKIKVVAFDAAPSEIKALEEGSVQALVVQNPFKMGYEGVNMAVKAIQGEEIPDRVDTGVEVVTQDNLNEPDIQKLLYPLGKKE